MFHGASVDWSPGGDNALFGERELRESAPPESENPLYDNGSQPGKRGLLLWLQTGVFSQ